MCRNAASIVFCRSRWFVDRRICRNATFTIVRNSSDEGKVTLSKNRRDGATRWHTCRSQVMVGEKYGISWKGSLLRHSRDTFAWVSFVIADRTSNSPRSTPVFLLSAPAGANLSLFLRVDRITHKPPLPFPWISDRFHSQPTRQRVAPLSRIEKNSIESAFVNKVWLAQ